MSPSEHGLSPTAHQSARADGSSANDVERWFQQTARQEDRTVSLYACLLTGRLLEYFRYRLRFALLLDTAQFAIHVAEFLIIFTTLGGLAAFTVMILRAGSLLVSGAWWGLVEVMRERLRVFAQAGRRDAIEDEIGRWLVLSVVLAALLAIATTVALALWFPPDHDPVGRFYAFLIVIELALRLPVRVLHSGIFATRRIYRPTWTLFAPEALQLLILGVGAFFYPAAAIVIAIIVTNAVAIWITVHYTWAAYRLSDLRPRLRAVGSRLRLPLPSIPPRLGAETALAGLGLRLDAVAVLAIAGIYGTNTRSFDLTAGYSAWRDIDAFQFFYLVLPLFRGGYEATGLFYFDFVRLRRVPAFRQFRVSFFHRILWLTPVIALYFWLLAVALGVFVLPDVPFSFLLALLPLFVVRSAIGSYQVRLFAEGQFGMLIATIVFTVGLFALVWIDVNPASDLVQITAAMIVLLIVHINLAHLQDRTTAMPTLLSMGDWIRTLAAEAEPVRFGNVVVPEWIPSRQRRTAVNVMLETLDGKGHFAFGSPTNLVFYQRASTNATGPAPHLEIQAATGATVNRGRYSTEPVANGRDAFHSIMAERWMRPNGGSGVLESGARTPEPEFRALFPDGIVLDLQTRKGKQDMRRLNKSVLATMLPAAMRSLEDGATVVRAAERRFTPIFAGGRLRLLCVLPPEPESAQIARWLRTVRAWNVGNTPSDARS